MASVTCTNSFTDIKFCLLYTSNDPELKGFLTRPQSAPVELNRRILDLAIIGEDWVREESVNLEGENIKKIGDLNYGKTRLIVAVPNDDHYESLSQFFRDNKNRENPILLSLIHI